jgi:hypothetical protein
MLAITGYLIIYFAAVKLAKEVTKKVIEVRRG